MKALRLQHTSLIIALILPVLAGAFWLWDRSEQAEAVASKTATQTACGSHAKPPAHYDHVIWIWEENRSFGQVMETKNAPFINNLTHQCAFTTKFLDNEPRQAFGSGYHSLSHYLADTSGSNCTTGNARAGHGCLDNSANNPAKSKAGLSTTSLFEQVSVAGKTWKSYQESAPRNCSLTGKNPYTPRHDAALYYTRIRQQCQHQDLPIPTLTHEPSGALIDDIKHDTLPAFAYVIPNLKHDMHDGSVADGDTWLRAYLEPLFASKSYHSGKTAVFVIWDEAPRASQMLPNLAIAPTAHAGSVSIPANGFAVLRTTEDMLGLPHLGCADGTPPGGAGQCFTGATTNLRSAFSI